MGCSLKQVPGTKGVFLAKHSIQLRLVDWTELFELLLASVIECLRCCFFVHKIVTKKGINNVRVIIFFVDILTKYARIYFASFFS